MREVAVTGLGAVVGRCGDASGLFDCLQRGESMVREHPRYRDHGFRNPALASIADEVWAGVEASLGECPPGWGPSTRIAVHVARQALRGSGLHTPSACRASRGGVFVGHNKSLFTEADLSNLSRHHDAATGRVDLDAFIRGGAHDSDNHYRRNQDTAALALADETGWQHCISTHGDACAAGGMAIGVAYRRIAMGDIDVALAGAAETMGNFPALAAFTAIGAMAPAMTRPPHEMSRPFDADRTGFVMGEGGAFLVLEAAQAAAARGAPVLAYVRGFANRLEAHRISASVADGDEYLRCMQAALRDAGLTAAQVDHVNAHGTSTLANDACEAQALKRLFGERCGRLPITANKSALGHGLACSGAIEAVLSVLSLRRQLLLPTLNFQRPDEACEGLDIVTVARQATVRTVLTNSFGFGGQNCALVLEKA